MLIAIISACEPTRKRAWQAHRVFTGSVGEAPADARTGKPAPPRRDRLLGQVGGFQRITFLAGSLPGAGATLP